MMVSFLCATFLGTGVERITTEPALGRVRAAQRERQLGVRTSLEDQGEKEQGIIECEDLVIVGVECELTINEL